MLRRHVQKNWDRQMWALQALAQDDGYSAVTTFNTEAWDTGHVWVKRGRKHRFADGTLSLTTEHESFVVGKRGGVKKLYRYSEYL